MKYLKLIIFIISIIILNSCKKENKSNVENNLINLESIVNVVKDKNFQEFSEIDFFKIKQCCLEKTFDSKNKRFQYSFNSKAHDFKIFFYPLKEKHLKEKQMENDISNYIEKNTIIDSYDVYVLFFPGKNLEPIYEGYDEPSYYDYTFPAEVGIYKLIKGNKWLLKQEKLMTEDEYYKIKKIDFRIL